MPPTSTHAAQSGFLRSVERYPDEVCLRWDGGTLTYAQMADRAMRIAKAVGDASPVAILAGRGPTAYAGVLGTLMAGAAYVPFNTAYPAVRNRVILERSGAAAVIADGEGLAQLPAILTDTVPETLIVADDPVAPRPDRGAAPRGEPAGQSRGVRSGEHRCSEGRRGQSRQRPGPCLAAVRPIPAEIRRPAVADVRPDLRPLCLRPVHDLGGARLVCPSRADLVNPAGIIREHGLTVWFSVPSAAMFMRRLGGLAPGSFRSLRAVEVPSVDPGAAALQASASSAGSGSPQTRLQPTEVTVACTVYRWLGEASRPQCIHGIVPSASRFPGSTCAG
jgi:hypothetical protein